MSTSTTEEPLREDTGDESNQQPPLEISISPSSEPIRIEDVYETLGGYSYFQIAATLIMILPEIPAGMLALLPVFTGRNNAPFFCETGFDTKTYSGMDPYICSKNCSWRTAESTYSSIVQEWDLVCDYGWISDTFTSIQMGGMMTGAFIASQMADFWGRKKAFYITTLFMGVFGIASGLAPDIYTFAIAKFLTGIGLGGYYSVYNIYLIEFLTPNWRTIVGCVSIWCIGEMVLALLGYLIHSWRILTIAASLPALAILCTFPVMPESPRWLLVKQKTKEANKAFIKIAQMNSKPVVDMQTIEALQASVCAEQKISSSEDTEEKLCGETSALRVIMKSPTLRIYLPIFLFGWFACALVYYGISFNTKNLSGDPYINVFYLGLVDAPAFPSGILFSNWLGRKKTFCMCLLVAATFLVILVGVEEIFGLETYPQLITILCFCARFGAGGAWGIVSCYSTETFPTVVRSTCIGLCCLSANIGGVLAPQLAYLGTISPALPYFIFCGFMVASAIASWFLGETCGKPLENFAH